VPPRRLNVAYAVPPESRKAREWRDGFTAAVELLGQDHEVGWLNLHPDDPATQRAALERLEDCDFLLVKSNWRWIVDELVRSAAGRNGPPRGLVISGVAKPPWRRRMRFYDVLFYETPWYGPRLRRHGRAVHAFGIDTRVMRAEPDVERDIDWLSVGAIKPYKRHERLLEREGRRIVVGDLSGADAGLLERLRAGGIEVLDFLPYEELAALYRRTRTVLVAGTLEGGGERAVLEARACGARVEVAGDNPKLLSLAEQEEVWDHEFYAGRLREGILASL
jgi:glycosyltransferase involved in cell wall biosynthesis